MPSGQFAIQCVGGKNATAVKADSAQSFARHTHDEYGIGVMLAGAQRSWSGRGSVEAGEGDLITVNPGEVHDGSPIGESRTWAMLYLSAEKITTILSDIHEGRSSDLEFTSPLIRDRRLAHRFAVAYAVLTMEAEQAAEEQLILLVAELLRNKAALRPTTNPSLAKVKARIDNDPAGEHRLDELSRQAGASRFQTLRGFAQITGLTPHAYVVQRRLEAARSIIRYGLALVDASSAAGFADQSHFHRAFTRRYGLTPGEYAKAVR